MRIVALSVQQFGCIKQAKVEFSDGLNLLHGQNDIGKSTLVQAMRAALLLPHTSSTAAEFVPWQEPGAQPRVSLTLRVLEDGAPRYYRVSKVFGRSAHLEWSNDGRSFNPDQAARAVDEKLRTLLQWGVPKTGASRGMPDSFLMKVLMASQPEVTAVLGAALADDKDTSGKQRISDALEAMAEDPLFKKVIAEAMTRTREAFTDKGRRRTGKGSPWITVRDKINASDEEVAQLRTQLDESQSVLAKVRRSEEEVLEAVEAVARKRQHLAEVKSEWVQRQQIEALKLRVEQVQVELHAQQKKVDDAERARAEEAALAEAATKLKDEVESAQRAVDAHLAEAAAAMEELQRQEGDAAREAELKESHLRERRTQLAADVASLKRELELIEVARQAEQKLQAQQALVTDLENSIGDAESSVAQRQADFEKTLQKARSYDHLLDYWRLRDASEQLERSEAAENSARLAQQEAAELRQRATAIETDLNGLTLPSAEDLAPFGLLHAELQVQEKALNLGLTAVVTPEGAAVDLEVSIDDGAAQAVNVSGRRTYEGKRALKLKLAGVSVHVGVGAADQMRKLSELRERWRTEVQPVLAAAGAESLDELEAAVARVDKKREELAELQQRATAKDTAALGLAAETDRAAKLRQRIEAGRRALAESGTDQQTLRERSERYQEEGAIKDAKRNAEEMKLGAEALLAEANDAFKVAQANLEAARGQLPALERATSDAEARIEGDWRRRVHEVESRLAEFEAERDQLDVTVSEVANAQGEKLARTKAKVIAAEKATETAQAGLKDRSQALSEAERALHTHRGTLTALTDAARSADVEGATLALQAAKHELAEATAGRAAANLAVESDVAAAEAELTAVEAGLQEKRNVQAEARGGLLQVGGAAIEEDLADAQQALAHSKREQDELELDYGAWQLLEATLREAEKSEAANLGEKLGTPVAQRFAALTAGRYQRVDVGPDLTTAGFVAAGQTRDVVTLSAGTQEQLSTIFRLCLAEKLQTAVILDDHLSQTDSERMQWFRNTLDTVASKAQVIVITCWPEHYAGDRGTQGVGHTIAVGDVVERY